MTQVIFLHGFGGSPQSWSNVLGKLPSSWRCWTPTLYGHGPIEQPMPAGIPGEAVRLLAELPVNGPIQTVEKTTSTSQPTSSRQVVSFWQDGGAEQWWLVGYSLGARVALGMLDLAPKRFAGALLIGVNPGLVETEARLMRARVDEGWARLLEQEGSEAFWTAWERQPLFEGQQRLDPATLEEQRRLRHLLNPVGLASAMRVLSLAHMPDYEPMPLRLKLPIGLVVGAEDHKFRALLRALKPQLPQAFLEEVAGCGHNVVLESPDAIVALLYRLMH